MRIKGLIFCALALLTAWPVWSDEPPRTQAPVKQRVNPKVLREALALQEYQTRSSGSSTPSLDELQRLHEKLKKNGDDAEADVIQRFITEHRRLITQSIRHIPSVSGKLIVHAKVFEIHPSDLAPSWIAAPKTTAEPWEIESEIERLVSMKRAKMCTHPFLIEGTTSVPVHCFADGEFLLPVQNEHLTKLELPDLGAVVEVLPVVLNNEKLRLKTTCEAIDDDFEHSFAAGETTIPERSRKRFQSIFEMKFGDSAVQSFSLERRKRSCVVFFEVTPRN